MCRKNKVLHSFEQQKIEFEQRQNTENNQEKTFSSEESNSKPFMVENQNDEIVIREDSYNPFVTKTSESLIADDESSGYNNTREKMKTTSKSNKKFYKKWIKHLIRMTIHLCKIMRIKRLMIIMM